MTGKPTGRMGVGTFDLERRGAPVQRFRAMSETSLYPAVKRFLEAAGFDVKGEVKGCDIVAVHAGEPLTLAIVEMKLGLSLELLLQAMDRTRVADEVWLAVPATRRGRDRDRRVHRLCRLLGFGCWRSAPRGTASRCWRSPGRISRDGTIAAEPGCWQEHARRRGDPSVGGMTRQPIMTAYRQQALDCAALLRTGLSRPAELRSVAPDAGQILLRNVYGWFERQRRGVYQLTPAGEAALHRWPAEERWVTRAEAVVPAVVEVLGS